MDRVASGIGLNRSSLREDFDLSAAQNGGWDFGVSRVVMGPQEDLLNSYLSSGIDEVEGWFGGDQITFFTHADQLQKAIGVTGGVVEIGVHHGRLFTLLMLLRRPDEVGLAIDVFDLQHLNYDQSGRGNLDAFLSNIRRFTGSIERMELLKSDSMQVSAQDILSKLGGMRARMFSVDGSHTTYATANDLQLAHNVIAPGGIIVVDDYSNSGFPMVAEGVARFMLLTPSVNIAPIISGANKIVFTTKSHHERYLRHFQSANFRSKPTVREFYSHPCLCY